MTKKGFTLVELIGTITLLALISLIALPPIMNQIVNSKDNLSQATLELIYSATQLYVSENETNYPKNNGNVFCVSLNNLVEADKLSAPLKDIKNGNNINLSRYVKVTVTMNKDIYELTGVNDCSSNVDFNPNPPLLTSNMIPIVFNDDGTVVKADINNKWYDYTAKTWANAVVVKPAKLAHYKQLSAGVTVHEEDILMYYVWIPRYKYSFTKSTITGTGSEREIAIKFEAGISTTGTNITAISEYYNIDQIGESEYKTHPAFSLSGKAVSGFWIGKFETGYNQDVTTWTKAGAEVNSVDADKLLIKPNIPSWRGISLVNIYNLIKSLETENNIYGFREPKMNAHLLKNDEWGAVAYLSYSRYGKPALIRNNNSEDYLTGCAAGAQDAVSVAECTLPFPAAIGKSASSNYDFSGVYDLAGGAKEYVMGNYDNGTGTLYPAASGFVVPYPDSIYYNRFTSTNIATACGGVCYGQALSETNAWNNDKTATLSTANPWLTRGGDINETNQTGLFNYDISDGTANTSISFRIAIIND